MSSFNEIMINDLTDCEKFTRKHLVNMYNKYNPIWNAFKHKQKLHKVLTKKEKKLIDDETDDEISDNMRKNKILYKGEAKIIVLDRHLEVLTPLYIKIYNLHKALPEEIKPTHYACECGSSVLIANKSHHLKTQLHLDFVNHVPPKPKAETTVDCGCGKSFSLKNKSHHDKTKYHLDWVESLPF